MKSLKVNQEDMFSSLFKILSPTMFYGYEIPPPWQGEMSRCFFYSKCNLFLPQRIAMEGRIIGFADHSSFCIITLSKCLGYFLAYA